MADRAKYGPGDEIAAKYRLLRPLAEGGMAAVWVARNVDLEVEVAVKLLRAELVVAHSERLLREARMLARLQHPAIVRVLDCGTTELADPFIVMELLSGESLADTLERRGRLSSIEAVSLLLPVADGLRSVHEAGIVHRDIKPENIHLSSVGGRIQPKLLDFGIALADFVGTRRTTDGMVLGSPAYMSPEQAHGESEIHAGSDVWALAVVLYELIAGTCPFERENYNATLRAITDDPAPNLAAAGLCDELLASIVERGLEKHPSRRWQSAAALGTALAEWLWGQGITEDASDVSLRTAWLHRSSEAPLSLLPVTLPRSAASTPTVARSPSGSSLTSTPGLAVSQATAARSGRAGWTLGIAGAMVLAAGAGGFALWPSAQPEHSPAVSASRSARETPPVAPSATRSSETKAEQKPLPEPAADAGATPELRPEKAPTGTRRAGPRSSPREYRPRGI